MISKKLRFAVLSRDKFKCVYCGRGAKKTVLHVDHIYPLKHGGNNSIENLTTACRECNLGKEAKIINIPTLLQLGGKPRKSLRQMPPTWPEIPHTITLPEDIRDSLGWIFKEFCVDARLVCLRAIREKMEFLRTPRNDAPELRVVK